MCKKVRKYVVTTDQDGSWGGIDSMAADDGSPLSSKELFALSDQIKFFASVIAGREAVAGLQLGGRYGYKCGLGVCYVIIVAIESQNVYAIYCNKWGDFGPSDFAKQYFEPQHLTAAKDMVPTDRMEVLLLLWKHLGNMPDIIDKQGIYSIEKPFLHFSAGTHRKTIWSWFEIQDARFVVGEAMCGFVDIKF